MKYLFVFLFLSWTFNSFTQDSTSIIIGNLEIMTQDLGKLNFAEAQKACADLGDGWRLPKKDEFNVLCSNKVQDWWFYNSWYWTSSEFNRETLGFDM